MRTSSVLGILALTTAAVTFAGPPAAQASSTATQQSPVTFSTRPPGQLRGVNLAGGEWGGLNVTPGNYGKYGTDYAYPTHEEIDHFAGAGMNVIRLPFLWERIQKSQYGDFDSTEIGQLDDLVNYATAKNVAVILDPHNYARYYGQVIGSDAVGNGAFANLWSRLAERYGNRDKILFNLMNEPHHMPTEQWLGAANAAIAAIRDRGANNQLIVPGVAWTGGASWTKDWYGSSNASVMSGVVDPANKFWFDLHTYFDDDEKAGVYSGYGQHCAEPEKVASDLQPTIDWLRKNQHQAFIGEFNAPTTDTCMKALYAALTYFDGNSDVLTGWTYWAAGPLVHDIIGSNADLEPIKGVDQPQYWALQPHLPWTQD